jgi:hypothetical protein
MGPRNLLVVGKLQNLEWLHNTMGFLFSKFLSIDLFTLIINKVVVKQAEGKGPLGKPRRRWEDNIMMEF